METYKRPLCGWIIAAVLSAVPLTAVYADDTASANASSKAAAPTQGKSAATSHKPLDLRAPALNRVFTRNEIASLMAKPEDVAEDVVTTVDVEGDSRDRIVVPDGLWSIPWAVRHPTQAWRLFLPQPSK
jgi:hypothetical protein